VNPALLLSRKFVRKYVKRSQQRAFGKKTIATYFIRHNEQEYLKKLYGIPFEMHLLFMDSILQSVDKNNKKSTKP